MRNNALILLLFILGCSRPSAQKLPDSVAITGHSAGGLWFTTANYTTGGHLGRLDLSNGTLARTIMPVGADTQIFPDEGGLLLLSRMTLDSVTALHGVSGTVAGTYLLPSRVNPQGAARDASGRVWVASQESNSLFVLSPDLTSVVGAVDLGSLSASGETLADLAQVAPLDAGHMVVTAQRLHRTAGVWKPDAQSGIAVVDVSSLSFVSSLLDVSNPVHLSTFGGDVNLVGAGDLSSTDGLMGRLVSLGAVAGSGAGGASGGGVGFSVASVRDVSAKIIAADDFPGAEPALIVWYVSQNKSCVEIGSVQLVCDGSAENQGYVFGSIRRSADHVFVSYTGGNQAELWVIPVGAGVGAGAAAGAGIQRVPMDMPVQSLSFGP